MNFVYGFSWLHVYGILKSPSYIKRMWQWFHKDLFWCFTIKYDEKFEFQLKISIANKIEFMRRKKNDTKEILYNILTMY